MAAGHQGCEHQAAIGPALPESCARGSLRSRPPRRTSCADPPAAARQEGEGRCPTLLSQSEGRVDAAKQRRGGNPLATCPMTADSSAGSSCATFVKKLKFHACAAARVLPIPCMNRMAAMMHCSLSVCIAPCRFRLCPSWAFPPYTEPPRKRWRLFFCVDPEQPHH